MKVDVLSINRQGNRLVMQAKVGNEMVKFEFTVDNSSDLRVIYGDETFSHFARYNSEFEGTLYKLTKRIYHGEELTFPIKLSFE